MKYKTTANLILRKSAAKKSLKILTIGKGKIVKTLNNAIRWDGNLPYVKVKYNKKIGYVCAKYLKGYVIKSEKTTSKAYPLNLHISNGTSEMLDIKVPQQDAFGEWLDKHGCSIVAACIGLQLKGIFKSPSELYKVAAKDYKRFMPNKLTLYGTSRLLMRYIKSGVSYHELKGKADAEDIKRIDAAVRNGDFVLIEQKNPIHTNIIVGRSGGRTVIATNGTIKYTTVTKLIKIASHNATHNGYIIIKK